MKKIILSCISTILVMFSISSFADKIVITGQPIVVQKQAGVYVPNTTVMTTDSGYYYFNVDNVNQVCYKEVNPALVSVNASVMAFRFGQQVVQLHCYVYSPDYFVVQ